MKQGTAARLLGSAALATMLATGAAVAQDFPSQEITLIVPYGPGGGFDTAARLTANYMERHLGEGASIVVENMPGGGGNIGISRVYTATPDGHTIGIVNIPGHFGNQVVETAAYDLFELEYIGNVSDMNYVTALSPQSPHKSIEDLQAAERVTVALTSLSSTDTFATMDALGINMSPIMHAGASEAILSALRGDVDLVQYPVSTIRPYVQDGSLVPIVMHADERLEGFEDVPTIGELGHPEVLSLSVGNRVLYAPPNTDADALAALRAAFDAAVSDPDYLAQVEEGQLEYRPKNWEQAESLLPGAWEALQPYKEILAGN